MVVNCARAAAWILTSSAPTDSMTVRRDFSSQGDVCLDAVASPGCHDADRNCAADAHHLCQRIV
jgi:hypothetical protein